MPPVPGSSPPEGILDVTSCKQKGLWQSLQWGASRSPPDPPFHCLPHATHLSPTDAGKGWTKERLCCWAPREEDTRGLEGPDKPVCRKSQPTFSGTWRLTGERAVL